MTVFRVALVIAASLFVSAGFVDLACAALMVTFHDAPPLPDADDQYNFVGGSRDGLNVNDDNGLDGPLNDDYTYVANDRPRQGQMFKTLPANNIYKFQSLWIQTAGYTNNGAMPEPGYNGTETDFSEGGVFTLRILEWGPLGGIQFVQSYELQGDEPNNPNSSGPSSTANGLGTWLEFSPLATGAGGFKPNTIYGFDIVSPGMSHGVFEWLGTKDDVYSAGSAYNGSAPGKTAPPFESDDALHSLIGDRVFMVQMVLAPEPSSLVLAALITLALPRLRRRRSQPQRGDSQ